MLNLKFGNNYQSPSLEEIEDHRLNFNTNKIHQNDFANDVNNFMMENIPRKVKKQTKLNEDNKTHNLNNLINEDLLSDATTTSNLNTSKDKITKSSTEIFKASRDINKDKNTPKIPDSINLKNVYTLTTLMKKEKRLHIKLAISKLLNKVEDEEVLEKFTELQGTSLIANWISDFKERIERESNDINFEENHTMNEVINNILNLCGRITISVYELKTSRIGKKINKLGKIIKDDVLRKRCKDIVEKWKLTIETKEEKLNEIKDRNINYLKKKRHGELTDDVDRINSNSNTYRNSKESKDNVSNDRRDYKDKKESDKTYKKYVNVINFLSTKQYTLFNLIFLMLKASLIIVISSKIKFKLNSYILNI